MLMHWIDADQRVLRLSAETEADHHMLDSLVSRPDLRPAVLAGAREEHQPLDPQQREQWRASGGTTYLIGGKPSRVASLEWDTRGVPGGLAALPPKRASAAEAHRQMGSRLTELLGLLAGKTTPQADGGRAA